MPIKQGQIPQESITELKRSMGGEMNRNRRFTELSEEALGGAPVLRFAHETFTLTPSDILGYVKPESTTSQSWRYLVPGPQGPSVAEVAQNTSKTEYSFSQSTSGLHSQLTGEALRWMHDGAELGDDTYEIRGLRIPALLIDALWLKNLSRESADLYAVIQPVKQVLAPKTLYKADDFFSALRDMVKAKPAFDNSPVPGDQNR